MDNVQHVYYSLYSVYLQQSHLFIKSAHDVHVLDGLARGAFDEIVNCRKNDDAVFGYLCGNIAEVSEDYIFRPGHLVAFFDTNKGFFTVKFPVEFVYLIVMQGRSSVRTYFRFGIDGAQNAEIHGNEMGNKLNRNLLVCFDGKDMLDFRAVAMSSDAVCLDVLVTFAIVRILFGFTPAP